MEEVGNVVKYPLVTGAAVSLSGGLLSYITKKDFFVKPDFWHIIKSFLFVSTVGVIVELGREEKKLPFPR